MPRVLSVGQCGFDHGMIARTLVAAFDADVVGVATFDEAYEVLRAGNVDLLLVNRVTDRDGTSGVELIRGLKADSTLAGVPVMLVSNYADAQRAAESAGALRGFGKAEIGTPAAQSRLRSVLAKEATPAP